MTRGQKVPQGSFRENGAFEIFADYHQDSREALVNRNFCKNRYALQVASPKSWAIRIFSHQRLRYWTPIHDVLAVMYHRAADNSGSTTTLVALPTIVKVTKSQKSLFGWDLGYF